MVTIHATNVNDALPLGIQLIKEDGIPVVVRDMLTLELPEPVATVYEYPWQRVLFDEIRDANPFFHVMEALWILAGRNDVAFLQQFNKRMAEYSDNGEIFHGAYGHRLRCGGIDQLREAILKLKADPTTRQVVLQIWDKTQDLNQRSKDIPCNDLIFVKIRDNMLNITVCCRSNDIIWGCYGANAVQFSYLQEYLASMIGVDVGYYTQISDSYHAYVDKEDWKRLQNMKYEEADYGHDWYPLVEDPDTFDDELQSFIQNDWQKTWNNYFFPDVAIPIYNAWFAHKETKNGWEHANEIGDTAWRQACLAWLARRGDKP